MGLTHCWSPTLEVIRGTAAFGCSLLMLHVTDLEVPAWWKHIAREITHFVVCQFNGNGRTVQPVVASR